MVYFYNYFDTGKDSEDETTTMVTGAMVTGAGIVAAGAGDEPQVGAATVRLGEKTGRGAQKRIDPLNDRSGIYCSGFSQTHNVGNIANFVFQERHLQFLHYFHYMPVKFYIRRYKGILFANMWHFCIAASM